MSGSDTPFVPRTAPTATPRPVPAWAKKRPPKSKAAVRTSRATVGATRFVAPRDPNQHAHKIAEGVIGAWFTSFGGSSIEIPIGTVGALALLRQPKAVGPELANWVLSLQSGELPQLIKEIYLGHWITRPDLINRAIPIHDWAWNPSPDPQQLRAVHAVTNQAVNAGLLELTGHSDPYRRAQSDVLSPLLTGLRHKSDKKWRGEYHTPASVTDLMARVLVDEDFAQPDKAIGEPAVGSGGMLRSIAQRLRELQRNPHDYSWYGNDVDPLAAACAAVNTIIWDLGPRALIGCADSLANGDGGYTKTLSQAQDAYKQRDNVVEAASTIAASRRAFRLLCELVPDKEEASA
ncbi:N-6 DNA methylase [Streptomyces sp. NPDC095613]|uniref:N-6 DNA methylase n=1 Tax=Streptomyces sp. NPDC095613 TaxID=3155540 RepID=UPI00332CADC4